ncbi:MAG: histidinol-phosphate transaminase [Geminicoccaceae bacterium]
MTRLRPRPGILEIEPYVGGKAEAAGGAPAIKLSANESPLGPSPKAVVALQAAAAEAHRYPDGGAVRLRQAIGEHHGLDPDRIVCGAGSDELIQLLMRAYAGPGDEILHSAHGFLMFRLCALSVGATPVAAPERDLTTDVEALLARLTSRTRMVFVANPNNPTGSYLGADDLARLHAGLPEDVVLVIDAAYAEYVDRNDYLAGAELVDAAHNVVMTRTFSKLFGLAALRLGWLYAQPAVVDALHRIRGPFNVGALAQVGGVAALEDLEHQQRSRAHNDLWLPWLAREISALGLQVHPSVANFVLVGFGNGTAGSAEAASAWLERRGILARSMAAYGLPHCLRLSVGLEDDNRAVVDALREFTA